MPSAKIQPKTADNDELGDRNRPRLRMMLTSAGGQVGLLRCFRDAAAEIDVIVEIVGVDPEPEISPACLLADSAFSVPRVDDAGYVDAILNLATQLEVKLIVPGSALELDKLSNHQQRFQEKNMFLAVSGPICVSISRDYYLTRDLIGRVDGRMPTILARKTIRARPQFVNWPITVKPQYVGDVELGVLRLYHPTELSRVPLNAPVIFQEPVHGKHYVSQLLFDQSHRLILDVTYQIERLGHDRHLVATTVNVPLVDDFVKRLAAILPHPIGPVYVETSVTHDGDLIIMGFKPHFAPEYLLLNRAGANIALWLIESAMDRKPKIQCDFLKGLRMVKYEAPLFWTIGV